MPAPAPCATTRVATEPRGFAKAPETSPLPASNRSRSSSMAMRGMMPAVTGTLHLGTSGFAYDEWAHGVFYPEGVKQKERLSYYSSQLSSVEINYTFRRFPQEKTLATWREQAADGFTFTLKAN